MSTQENAIDLIKAVMKWRKTILWVCIGTAVLTAAISLIFLSNYYQSTTIFFSASPKMAQADIVFGWGSGEMRYYGDDFDTDRIITIAESNEVIDYLVDSFDLFEHYDIDTASQRASFKVGKVFKKLYDVQKNKREAIELSVEDTDPEIAMRMANAAREKVNEIGKMLVKNSQKDLVLAYQSNLKEMDNTMKMLSDSLMRSRTKYGIYSTTSQSEVYSSISAKATSRLAGEKAKLALYQEGYSVPRDSVRKTKARIANLEQQLSVVDNQIQQFNNGMGLVSVLEGMLSDMSERRSRMATLYQQLMATYTSEINAIHLVEEGLLPIVKSRPKRSIIVIVATIVAFVVMLGIAIVSEMAKQLNWKELLSDKKE